MCNPHKEIHVVQVREVEEGEQSQYWGWYDKKDDEVKMIYASIQQVKMCFPYGTEIKERMDEGRLVNLVLDEIGVFK